MKFKQIAATINDIVSENEILEEGLRFGQREMRQLEKMSRDIRIGIEYEYHVDDEHGDDEEESEEYRIAVYDRAIELRDEEFQNKKERFIEEFAENEMDEFNIEHTTSKLHDIKEASDDVLNGEEIVDDAEQASENWDSDDMDNGFYGFNNEQDIQKIHSFLLFSSQRHEQITDVSFAADDIEVDDQLDRFIHVLPDADGNYIERNWDDFKQAAKSFSEFVDDLSEEIENWTKIFNQMMKSKKTPDMFSSELGVEIKPEIQDLLEKFVEYIGDEKEEYFRMIQEINDIRGNDNKWDNLTREMFRESGEELVDSDPEVLGIQSDDEIFDTEFWERAEDEIHRDEYSSGNKIDAIRDMLEDGNNDWDIDYNDIEAVKSDASVPDGVETVTDPLPLNESMDLMEKMFNHIRDVGSTSMDTGMHVNMSFKNIDFSKKNFNPLKAVILLDPKTLKEFFNPRAGYTRDIFESITNEDIFLLTDNVKGASGQINMNDLIVELNGMLFSKRAKNQQMNFQSISDDMRMERRRVEFRYFGGADYEDRFNTIKFNIYRTAYILYSAFSEDFGEKEYKSQIIKILDEKSNEFFGYDFVELAKIRWSSGFQTDERDALEKFERYMNTKDESGGGKRFARGGMRIR